MSLADHQASDLERHGEPLVGVEGDGVGKLQPFELLTSTLGEDGESAVGSVDMQPDVAFSAELRQLHERVDRTRVRRAAGRNDRERQPPFKTVGVHRGGDRCRAQSEPLIRREDANLLGPETQRSSASRDRGVRRVTDVDHDPIGHRADQRLSSDGEALEVGRGATADEDALRAARVADPFGEPPEDGQLDLAGAGGLPPLPRVDVRRACDQIGQRGRPRPCPRDVGEEPRWSNRPRNGNTCSKRSSSTRSTGCGCSGAGPSSNSAIASRETVRSVGDASMRSARATSLSTTSYPRRRIASGSISNGSSGCIRPGSPNHLPRVPAGPAHTP